MRVYKNGTSSREKIECAVVYGWNGAGVGSTVGGAENDLHADDGHVSGVWIGLRGMDFDLAVLPSNRLLLRFQECSRSKSKLKSIRLYSDDHGVFHTWICLSIIPQLHELYTTYFAAVTCILPLFWKELHTAL